MRSIRSSLLGLTSVLALAGQAQESAPSNKWCFGGRLSPSVSYRQLNADGSATAESITRVRNDRERPQVGGGAEAFWNYRVSQRFSVEAGIGLSVIRYMTDLDELTFGDPIDPSRGFVSMGAVIEDVRIRYDYFHADLPIRAVFTLGKGRIRSISSLGLTTSVLVTARTTTIFSLADGSTERNSATNSNFDRLGLFATFSTGIMYALNDRIDLRIEPQARYGLLPIMDAPISEHLWSAGLGLGVQFRL